MLNKQESPKGQPMEALTRLFVLLALCIWMFWPELATIISTAPKSSETAHVLVTPVAILLLVYLRRRALIKSLTKGSMWGIALLVAGLAFYAGATWPFSYGYARLVAMVPVFAGAILVTCGWRVLKLSVPILLLLLLSLPMSSGLNARLVIRPETYTIATTARVLDQLPGIRTAVEGKDIFFSSSQGPGVIALGESNRGVRLLFAFGIVGVFVIFSRIRPRWRAFTAMLMAVPIAFFCNFLRFICWGLAVIYTGLGPGNALPRNISAVFSLFAAYSLFLLICIGRFNLLVEVNKPKK
jgi:exosortase